MTDAKNKTRLTENNSNNRAFRGQKARHPELEKRLCDYVDNKKQYGCAVTSEIYQLKALARHHGFQSCTAFRSSSSWQAGANLASSRDQHSVAMANHA